METTKIKVKKSKFGFSFSFGDKELFIANQLIILLFNFGIPSDCVDSLVFPNNKVREAIFGRGDEK